MEELIPDAGGGASEASPHDEPSEPDDSDDEEGKGKPEEVKPAVASPRRFVAARRDLGAFVRSGDTVGLARGIGHYSRTGMGGAATAASRMRASTSAGAGLVSFLQAARDGTDALVTSWVQDLLARNPSSDDVADAIVQALAPPGGSADEESLRDSMALAISELITFQPDVELLRMSDSDTWTLLQLFLGHEVCNRLEFDIGQFFESSRLDPELGVCRELEMRDFVKNEVGVQLTALRDKTPNPTKQQLDALVHDAVRMTFEVYEGVL
ncbi:hypothetical protein LP414_09500 [Polaromonas sp. P1(28)-13]|nr:hypothetical protein LP414_09500 [Polaromonas sp. P1(28)-13]